MQSRRGVALVAALGLLMLGAALLAGTSVASVELHRAVRGRVAGARAEWEGKHAAGMVVQGWSAEADSMPIGAVLERALSPPPDGPGTVVVTRVRRLAADRYAAIIAVRVGEGVRRLAFRRVQVLLERAPVRDSATAQDTPRVVMPIARWRVVDLW
jgi:hypothetical protein